MKKLKKCEKGFTLLELLIAIALTGIVTTAITMVIFQTFTGSTRSVNHMVAVRQVQEAGYWVGLYAYMAQGTEITGESGFPFILKWIDFDPPPGESEVQRHEVVFSLNSSGLRGKYYIDGTLDEERTGKIPAFEVINPDKTKTNCKFGGGSAFSLPDIGDAFNITGEATPDNGAIIVSTGFISVTTTGGATYDAGSGEWTTTTAGDIITVTATSSGTIGSWTSDTKAAAAGITVDSGAQSATLSRCKMLIFTVTATVGTGAQQTEETRIYKIVPKPVS